MPPARPFRYAAALAVVLISLSACSNRMSSVNRRPHTGATTASVVDGMQVVHVDATDTYRFDPSTITVHPGVVRIELRNVAKNGVGAPHNWAVPTKSVTTPLVAAGKTDSVTFTAPAPGHYTFVCTIHRKQGQTGTLVVLDR